jgi:two-component system response regulator HydG
MIPRVPAEAEVDQVLRAHWPALARTRMPVLVVGETGTGKTRLARGLHAALTPESPFVELNAASLSASLFCSELFGHERGAFTGAHSGKQGLVALAHGGTLFLDEIGELPMESQGHLLTFLDTGRYRPVGGLREQVASVRVVCATNRSLEASVQEGRFRSDLYYRLAHIVLALPPLRTRPERAILLLTRLMEDAAQAQSVQVPTLNADAIELVTRYAWPGNVRQLRAIAELLVAVHPAGVVRAEQLEALVQPVVITPRAAAESARIEVRPLAEVERELVQLAMERAGGNRTKAARMLGITPRGLYNKLRRVE